MTLSQRVAKANDGWDEPGFLLDLVNKLHTRNTELRSLIGNGWVGPAHVMENNGTVVVSMSFHAPEEMPSGGTLVFVPKVP